MDELKGYERLEGFGNFESGIVKVEAYFSVRWSHQYSSVVVEKFPTRDVFASGLGNHKEWHLKGKLNDGRSIRARGMILEHYEKDVKKKEDSTVTKTRVKTLADHKALKDQRQKIRESLGLQRPKVVDEGAKADIYAQLGFKGKKGKDSETAKSVKEAMGFGR